MDTNPHGLGYLPDIPKIGDYDENHAEVAPLLHRTRLATRVAVKVKALGITTSAPRAPEAAPQADLRGSCSPIGCRTATCCKASPTTGGRWSPPSGLKRRSSRDAHANDVRVRVGAMTLAYPRFDNGRNPIASNP